MLKHISVELMQKGREMWENKMGGEKKKKNNAVDASLSKESENVESVFLENRKRLQAVKA